MSNVVENQATPQEEVKQKRSRKATPKVQKTGADIVAEIETLQTQVDELEQAISSVDQTNVIYQLAEKELLSKRQELEDSKNTLYTYVNH